MRIEAGSKVAIVGSNGSGKTTLAFLLAGLHTPNSGSISVAAHPYQTLEESSFRNLVGILDQDPWFEHASIRANLELATAPGKGTDAVIQHACSIANILNFILSLPEGFETVIGENAMRLSSGQRQRLAIARLLLKRPSFIILDEFNSHLDTKTETEVFNLILDHFRDATLVIITHRFSILRRVDTIFHMSQGKIIESGSHSELIERGEDYAQLYNSYRDSL
jgi:ATP-binding cassette subfamily B protein